MRIIDISWPLSTATTGYKDKEVVKVSDVKLFDRDRCRETVVQLSSHVGTHIDAPSHFLPNGLTLDQLSLDRFCGPCKVIDMTAAGQEISVESLQACDEEISEGDIILFKTANSFRSPTEKFDMNFVYLHVSGARYLAEKKVVAVGIDYLGIERNQPGHLTHVELFTHDIGIIEGLRLAHVEPGPYMLYCLPLAMVGTEAAPARAILLSV